MDYHGFTVGYPIVVINEVLANNAVGYEIERDGAEYRFIDCDMPWVTKYVIVQMVNRLLLYT